MGWQKGRPRKPVFGSSDVDLPVTPLLPDGTPLPQAEVLGTIRPEVLREDVASSATWVSPNGDVVSLSTPPPWIATTMAGTRRASDARTFVDVPDDWILRWMDKKRVDERGWNYWMPVTTTTPGVKLKVASMRAPDNTIRRGYQGDILAFMPRHWYDQRVKEKQAEVDRRTAGAVRQQQQFIDNANRGQYGPHVRGGWAPGDQGKFPAQTQFVAGAGEQHPE